MRLLIFLISAILALAPADLSAQKRQRSKAKAKSTAVAKKSKPQTSAEAKKKQSQTQKEIKLTEDQIRQNEAEVKKNLAELGKIDLKIDDSNKKIASLSSQIKALNSQISSLEAGIEKNEQDLEFLRSEYLKAVKKMRVTKKNRSTLAFIFSSKSVSQAMRRMRYLREFSSWRDRHSKEISAKTVDLKNQRDALSLAQSELTNALNSQNATKNLLAQQHKEQQQIVEKLKKNGQSLQAHLKKKQAEARDLTNQISQLIAIEQQKAAEEARKAEAARKAEEARKAEAERKAEEERIARESRNDGNENLQADNSKPDNSKQKKKEDKSSSSKASNGEYASARKRTPRSSKGNEAGNNSSSKNSSKSDSSQSSQSSSGDFASMMGKLPYPSSGSFVITSRFGRQSMPDLPDVEFDNPGIDAETNAGDKARAVFKGKVSGVYLLPGYNTVVIVNHGNYYTVYGNISSPAVKIGDNVEAGSTLGPLALNDDDSSHASIHFEVWKNREKLNPQLWLH